MLSGVPPPVLYIEAATPKNRAAAISTNNLPYQGTITLCTLLLSLTI